MESKGPRVFWTVAQVGVRMEGVEFCHVLHGFRLEVGYAPVGKMTSPLNCRLVWMSL